MTKSINEFEFRNVVAQLGPKRYKYFVGNVVDWGYVWGLKSSDGWVTSGDQGRICLPVWPHEIFAKACATGEWQSCVPTAIEIHDFLDIWLVSMQRNNEHLAVFPTPLSNNSVAVAADFLEHDLRYELSRVE